MGESRKDRAKSKRKMPSKGSRSSDEKPSSPKRKASSKSGKKSKPKTDDATRSPKSKGESTRIHGLSVDVAHTGGVVPPKGARLSDVSHPEVLEKRAYERRLERLQLEMLRVQLAYRAQGERAVIVVEGPDAAGKGGMLRRMTGRLDPRTVRVHSIGAPRPDEQGRHYLWRFWQRLPAPGRIAIFDRSWYGRVLVERVEGFCERERWEAAYDEINQFEKMLVDDGVHLVKLFLYVSPQEQLDRFRERLADPIKRWKFTDEDLRNREQWPAYTEAFEDMFARTSPKSAPWHLIGANHKWFARIAGIVTTIHALRVGVDLDEPLIDTQLVRRACKELGLDPPPDLA